ncbi:hypothetical protein [Streptomyces sp. DG1A-41]|uniref:acyl-CoA-like ligand-binding transcription factor n=1 Tax=Streptomyces sp. DG1A-41 TaxID=3125779 RepID=UPI0030D0AC73
MAIDHLRTAYQPVLDSSSGEDVEAVLAVVRMTHDEPALRAAYLVLRERAEETFTEVLAERMGMPPGTFEVRVQAASTNAVLKVAADEFARETAGRGITPEVLNDHREQLAHALGLVTRRLSGTDTG